MEVHPIAYGSLDERLKSKFQHNVNEHWYNTSNDIKERKPDPKSNACRRHCSDSVGQSNQSQTSKHWVTCNALHAMSYKKSLAKRTTQRASGRSNIVGTAYLAQ
jgi:hypothetical protein